MDKTKRRDVAIKILSVFLAFLLWLYVTSEQDPETEIEISNVPVKLVNVEALSKNGLVLLGNPDGYTIKITVKGRTSKVVNLKPYEFTAEANMATSYVAKGKNSIPVEIKDWPKDIEIPNQGFYINVELDELNERNFKVSLQTDIKTKEGYAAMPAEYKPEEVVIKGAAKYIGSINSVIAKVQAEGAASDIVTSVPIQVLDKNGGQITELEVLPKTIDVVIPVKKSKEVPVNIKTTGFLPNGVHLKSITPSPDKVSIIGDDNVINNIKSIDTFPIDLNGISSNAVRTTKLNIPKGITLINSSDTINANINVEVTTSRQFNVPVNYSNLPSDLTAEPLANNVVVTLYGHESVLNDISPGDLSATIDLSSAPADGGEFEYAPNITTPPSVEIKDVNPSKIKVRISKKQ